jgi:Alpha-2-macroglobulin bait region domain
VQVKSTEALMYLYYQVIGKGGVLVSQRIKPYNLKVFVFNIWATFAMVPTAELVVYYYRPNGEIIADRVTLKFENRLDNYVGRNNGENNKFEYKFGLSFYISGQNKTVRHTT